MMPPPLVAPFMPTAALSRALDAALSLVSPATSDDDFLIWDEHDVAAGGSVVLSGGSGARGGATGGSTPLIVVRRAQGEGRGEGRGAARVRARRV